VTRPRNDLFVRLTRINPTAAFVAALVLVLAGFLLPGIVGAALLFLLGAALAALTFTTWPVQSPSTRAVRTLLLALLLGAVISKAM
jgi:uncharacterized membrane protein